MRKSGGWPDLDFWFFCCLNYSGGVNVPAVDSKVTCAGTMRDRDEILCFVNPFVSDG
jgi:hypothetical protein